MCFPKQLPTSSMEEQTTSTSDRRIKVESGMLTMLLDSRGQELVVVQIESKVAIMISTILRPLLTSQRNSHDQISPLKSKRMKTRAGPRLLRTQRIPRIPKTLRKPRTLRMSRMTQTLALKSS